MKIGENVRAQRKSKDITLRELSAASGVALATLSRIETNKMTGTIQSHQAIASALDLTLPQLYGQIDSNESAIEFQSLTNRTDSFVHNDKASYYMLTNNVLSKKMMPIILKIAPGGITTQEALSNQAEKFIYILKGQCIGHIGSEKHNLKKGETLYFDASIKHYFENNSKDEMQAICIITPPAL